MGPARHSLPTIGPVQCRAQLFVGDSALGDHRAIDQNHGDAEVVKPVQLVVGVDIMELGLDAQLLQQAQGVLAKVASLSRHEDDVQSGPGTPAQPAVGCCGGIDTYAGVGAGGVTAVRTSLTTPEPYTLRTGSAIRQRIINSTTLTQRAHAVSRGHRTRAPAI